MIVLGHHELHNSYVLALFIKLKNLKVILSLKASVNQYKLKIPYAVKLAQKQFIRQFKNFLMLTSLKTVYVHMVNFREVYFLCAQIKTKAVSYVL